MIHDSWVEVNLTHLAGNYRRIKAALGRTVKVLGVVKQEAYGHGLLTVSKALEQKGIDFLGVHNTEEALQLRQGGVKIPILVLSRVLLPQDFEQIAARGIRLSIADSDILNSVISAGNSLKHVLRVHLKIDTGMNRLGFYYKDVPWIIEKLLDYNSRVGVEGVFSHLSSADSDHEYTRLQRERFEYVRKKLAQKNILIPIFHLANSAGVAQSEHHFNMVRAGLSLYGVKPFGKFQIPLQPVLEFKTRVVSLRRIPSASRVSYGGTFVTKKPTNTAVISCGYAYGYPWALSNKGWVLIRGKKARILGRVCMDHIIVDVSCIPGVSVGDEVVLLGKQGKEVITADCLAALAATIPYEILCGISHTIPRVPVR